MPRFNCINIYQNQRWNREHKARGQGQGHKKIRGQSQGQEQPFQGQTLSRLRTEMLEAKDQARSQKFAMGGAVLGVWGRIPQPPDANGGLGAKPQPPEAGGLGAEPPAAGGTGV